ncbi:MAG: CDP-diacylglycerol--glycerol-3-phosphate 3-phosphatidyltransferase [Verrucomicrobiales bacterium]
MNLPNQLTVFRLFLTGVFVVAMSIDLPGAKVVAFLVFVVASLTDWADGAIARARGLITDFGKLMDPLADKILVAAAYILFIPLGLVPGWMVIALISREFVITGLRQIAAGQGQILAAEKLGKHKTIWQMVTAVVLLLYVALQDLAFWFSSLEQVEGWGQTTAGISLRWVLLSVVFLLTMLSAISYLWKNRALISEC